MGFFKKNGGEYIEQNRGEERMYPYSGYADGNVCYIKQAIFRSLRDVEIVKRELMKGNIMILNAENLLTQDGASILELKRAIEQLRGICRELGGSMGRIGEHFLILTPNPAIRI